MTAVSTGTTTWTIDPAHSTLAFAVRHMMFTTASGRFLDFDGTIVHDSIDVENCSVDVTIQVGSVATGNGQRDTHLRSGDFLDVERYPISTFRSTRIESRNGDIFAVYGDLTIMGVTREVVLDTVFQGTGTVPGGPEVVGFQATTALRRSAFGLTWNVPLESGGVLVSDEVRLTLDVQAARTDGQE